MVAVDAMVGSGEVLASALVATTAATAAAYCLPVAASVAASLAGGEPVVHEAQAAEARGDDFLMTLECELPPCLEIRETQYGRGLFATEPIPAGQLIYKARFFWLPEEEGKVLLKVGSQEFILDMHTHFPLLGPGRREVNEVDSFTNHSCDPNIFYDDIRHNAAAGDLQGDYCIYALRDIAPGTELTCDYELFDWDCMDKAIEKCLCGSSCCRGSIRGTKYLPFEQVLDRLAELEPLARGHFLREHPEVCYLDLGRATGVRTVSTAGGCGWALCATKDFEPGDFVLERSSHVVDARAVRFVACNVPVQLRAGGWQPRTLIFSAEGILDASAAAPGGTGDRREFFGLSIVEEGCGAANAELVPSAPQDGVIEPTGCCFEVRAAMRIERGEIVACAAPPAATSRPRGVEGGA